MKVETIVNVFKQKNQLDLGLIPKTLNTIKDFKRKTELRLSFREVKEVFTEYIKEEENIIKKIISDFCNEQNELNKDVKNWKELKSDELNRIPPQKMKEFQDEIKLLLDIDIKVKKPLKFYVDEIECANLLFTEEEELNEFIIWDKKKKSKPKK